MYCSDIKQNKCYGYWPVIGIIMQNKHINAIRINDKHNIFRYSLLSKYLNVVCETNVLLFVTTFCLIRIQLLSIVTK